MRFGRPRVIGSTGRARCGAASAHHLPNPWPEGGGSLYHAVYVVVICAERRAGPRIRLEYRRATRSTAPRFSVRRGHRGGGAARGVGRNRGASLVLVADVMTVLIVYPRHRGWPVLRCVAVLCAAIALLVAIGPAKVVHIATAFGTPFFALWVALLWTAALVALERRSRWAGTPRCPSSRVSWMCCGPRARFSAALC